MAKQAKKKVDSDTQKKIRPASSPEARESQLIALAYDAAEEQLLNGTASSQVITHFLKLATEKYKNENLILEKQKVLIEAKTENLKSAQRSEELFANAIAAMRRYSGSGGDPDDSNI